MKSGYAPVCRLLCGAVLLSSVAGCATGREQAESECRYLYPGMSMQEVADHLGDPHQVIRGEPGSETVWVYRYEGGPNTAAVVVGVLLFVAIVALVVASKSGGGFGGGVGGGSDGPPCQIRLRFAPAGRLIDFTTPLPIPAPAPAPAP